MFRVVPDQLRISGGWVRCGNCDEVFDGNSHLQPLPNQQPTHQPPSVAPQPPVAATTPPAPVAKSPEPAPQTLVASLAEQQAPLPVDTFAKALANGAAEVSSQAEAHEPDPLRVPSMDPFLELRPREHIDLTTTAVADELHLSALGDVAPAAPPQPRYVQAERPEGKDAAGQAPLSFMRSTPKHRKGVSLAGGRPWVAALVASLSLAALGAQFVWHERDALAAAQPAVRPALEAMCGALGCRVHAFRQIESVLIENSGFAKVRAETYRLSVTLRNSAEVPIAVPALELTLTDALDQPLIRRVLKPDELVKNQATIAAGGEVNVVLPLGVADRGGRPHFTGYRVLAFYP